MRFSEIAPEQLAARDIRAVFADLDNTLEPYGAREPSGEALLWFERLRAEGVALAVVSNAGRKRVSTYCRDIPHAYKARKPNPGAILDMARRLGIEPRHVLFIGDQLRTDMRAARRAGVGFLRVDPVSPNLFHRLRYSIEKRFFTYEAG
ncbi:MAG: HAD-IIIA family hydrolase [Oscillospiraceae bacterium]|jgi:HAD superfamily phosphatase (TIGR01668 family)|nr:HAD-IIIA family hydrolase [Oscillospiraceae bacterium]